MDGCSHPCHMDGSEWVKWAFKTRQRNQLYAVELVEGWTSGRIMLFGMLPWVASCLIAIVWSVKSGDVQTALAVAAFVLTASGGKFHFFLLL